MKFEKEIIFQCINVYFIFKLKSSNKKEKSIWFKSESFKLIYF